MPEWRIVIQWLQDIANDRPWQFGEVNDLARRIYLAHYEEIY